MSHFLDVNIDSEIGMASSDEIMTFYCTAFKYTARVRGGIGLNNGRLVPKGSTADYTNSRCDVF